LIIAATVIGIGSFLFFAVQPMVAKTLLPVFGGASSVWTVCLLFFQTTLLAGYAYAHATTRQLHIALLAAAVVLASGAPSPAPNLAHPNWALLKTLVTAIGLPALVLGATSPLTQRWSGLSNPYRLYAVANAASLTALLAYPAAVEPLLSLPAQWKAWQGGFVLFAMLSAVLAWRAQDESRGRLQLAFRPLWMAAPAATAALLMATTNQLTQEVASVPFLWVAPLSVYLLTYILAFGKPGWYRRRSFAIAAGMLIPISCTLTVVGINVGFGWHLAAHSATLFVCGMLCHGELAWARPEPAKLTSYYLAIAAGGAMGGLLVAFIAPLMATSYVEFPLAMAACAVVALPKQWADTGTLRRAAVVGLTLAASVPFTMLAPGTDGETLAARRNFYGILRVTEDNGKRTLTHGAITHGTQLLERPRTPTTYYGYASAVGQVLEEHPLRAKGKLRVGIIGLGVGTLARYGRPGDFFCFYELNPEVVQMARQYFTFLRDSPATQEIVVGDARLMLELEQPRHFDVLIVDAFSSDAIPVHLLTREAGIIYRRHLTGSGVLLIHISNHTLNLEPVVRGLGKAIGYTARRVDSSADATQGVYAATWMVLEPGTGSDAQPSLLWRDDFSSILPLLKGWPVFRMKSH
jgi:hypothetical protein